MTDDQVQMGKRIARLRLDRGWTQQELGERITAAERSTLAEGERRATVTGQTVSKWERGIYGVEAPRLAIVAQVLGTTRGYLLDGTSVVVSDESATEPIPGLAELFPPGSTPTPDEYRWLRQHPAFHRVDLRAMHHALISMRLGLTPEQAAASREATERFRDPNVPPRKR